MSDEDKAKDERSFAAEKREDAGVPWTTFHTFRHTYASMLFDQGRNAKQVQRWLGHHSAAFMLEKYIHLLSDELDAPLELPASVSAQAASETALALAS